MNRHTLLAAALLILPGAIPAAAHAGPPTQPGVKGTQQMKGGACAFGQIVSLDSGFNFQILSARYSLDPYVAPDNSLYPEKDQKLLILQVAVKNNGNEDQFFNREAHEFTAVDQNNQDYTGNSFRLESLGGGAFETTLKPGQGYGQKPTDPFTVAIRVAAKAKIGKIILNRGRAGTSEDVIRYFVAGTEGGNPKNVIAPLPDYARDPKDPSGAIALDEGAGKVGVDYPSGYFTYRLDGLTYSEDAVLDSAKPEDGKRFAIATVTVTNRAGENLGEFYFAFDGEDGAILKDADGERYPFLHDPGLRKAKRDEKVSDVTLKPGESYTVRYFFQIPNDAAAKTLTLGQPGHRVYTFDVTDLK